MFAWLQLHCFSPSFCLSSLSFNCLGPFMLFSFPFVPFYLLLCWQHDVPAAEFSSSKPFLSGTRLWSPGDPALCEAAADPQLWPGDAQTFPAGPGSGSLGAGAAFHLGGNAGWCFKVWNSLTSPAAHLGWGPYQGDNFKWLNHPHVMQWNTGSLSRKQTIRPLLQGLQTFSWISVTIQRLRGGQDKWKSGVPFFALYKVHSAFTLKMLLPGGHLVSPFVFVSSGP